ncbi:MAG: hypothetical protein A4E32_01061 [Methanomassiliicoccales archaeon PtaU1.Bin124]|nr:MAG: hypothetical protein A4E32_01061 [Methanomassiliicoccales archaeon PtaU1.Bin124]
MTLASLRSGSEIMKVFGKNVSSLAIVCLLAAVQSALRLALAGVIFDSGFPATEKVVASDVQAYILAMFVALGVLGFLFTYLLYRRTSYGYYGTIVLSAVTIVFDVWAIYAIQPTPVLGIVLPVGFIVYLVLRRKDFPAVN